MTINTAQIEQLARDIRAARREIDKELRKTMFKAAMNMKREMIANATGTRYYTAVAGTTTFDLETSSGVLAVEVGPVGGLGGYAYEGSPTAGPSLPEPLPILEAEARTTERFALDILSRAWRR